MGLSEFAADGAGEEEEKIQLPDAELNFEQSDLNSQIKMVRSSFSRAEESSWDFFVGSGSAREVYGGL